MYFHIYSLVLNVKNKVLQNNKVLCCLGKLYFYSTHTQVWAPVDGPNLQVMKQYKTRNKTTQIYNETRGHTMTNTLRGRGGREEIQNMTTIPGGRK